MKTMTALGSGTVPLPPDHPDWRDPIYGMRVGETRTDIIDGMPITVTIGIMRGMRFIKDERR